MHRVTKKLADGSYAIYVYETRGGRRIRTAYGATREAAEGNLSALREPPITSVVGAVTAYLEGSEFNQLKPSTRDAYERYLIRFAKEFGAEPLSVFSDFRTRRYLVEWRNEFAHTPRGADYMMRAVAAFFTWARGRGLTDAEPVRGIKALHRNNRSDEIWTRRDFHKIRPHCTPALYRAIRLAGETGLRRGDLIGLRWDQIDADTIQLITRKTSGVAIVPLTRIAKHILARIDRAGPVVLKGQRGTPWTAEGIATEFQKAKKASGVTLRFHDLRGTAATRFRAAGYTNEEIARAMGWTVGAVEVLMTRYVKNAEVMKSAIARVNRRQTSLQRGKDN